ncbi:hypothetical protein TanjilG_18603 [Lupinus angustifolius]|uniref:Kinesin-like protein n=1 Tax=Lupinus angustifolius TaxID=3871 RepID=A0A394DC21_LUPAN|nr:hypothetical protein TanjilG_18603 [Lupinus angustifolius]
MASTLTLHRNGVAQPHRLTSNFRTRLSSSSRSSLRRRCANPAAIPARNNAHGGVTGRVRVFVRLRPRNTEEMMADADFADCVELQPELKRLKLRKNNWDSDTYEFEDVLTEFASQKRVYEVVAKPVVESVLDGYNGTVMAYGQTRTGKTFTLGQLWEEDTSDRGVMVRSMEDILADLSPITDSIVVSYLQLYIETIQDLLNLVNDNIPIVEDPRTGTCKRCVVESEDIVFSENDDASHLTKPSKPLVRKSKLVVVDLAGSERIHKSGSEGHMLEEAKFINLSLSTLGKCINALAENSTHVPFRDSKLTRLLKDSFGGMSQAMKVENMLKIKEEFDYKSLSRKLEVQLDKLIAENERQQKAFEDELERITLEAQCRIAEVERSFTDTLEKERLKCQMEYMESVTQLEQNLVLSQERHDCNGFVEDRGEGHTLSSGDEVAEVKRLFENESKRRKAAEEEVENLKSQHTQGQRNEDETVRRIAAGAIANLAMNEANQELIMAEGGITLLSMTASDAVEPQTLRMVAGAIANLRGNDKVLMKLRSQGAIKALLAIVRCGHPDVLSQVARGIGNFAKCESLASSQEDGALPWIVQNANNEAAAIKHHMELALCHLAQHELNAKDMISGGALRELVRISWDCTREDIRNLARETINDTDLSLLLLQNAIWRGKEMKKNEVFLGCEKW